MVGKRVKQTEEELKSLNTKISLINLIHLILPP